jgi:SagB-type dehydrogenase family enzyme
MPLGAALRRRSSIRAFELKPLALARLGRLLYGSFGVKGIKKIENLSSYDRPAPSAGGLYPLELYVATQSVRSISDGVYHYLPVSHQLETISIGAVHSALPDLTIGQDMIGETNVVVVIAAVFYRTMWKYGQRGYRYVWLDAGHLAQNIYLIATAMRLGAVSIGGFFDSELHALLHLPEDEQPLYALCVGHPTDAPKRSR